MSSKTRWSRQKKIDKIIADELPKPKQPSKSKPSLPTCYEFERQFIENLTDSNGEIVLKYGMVCTTKPNKVVHRASHFSRVFAQYGGTGNPEILANLLNEAVQNIPDFKGTFVQGVGVSKRQEKSIKDYLDPIKKRLENIKKLLEIVPESAIFLVPFDETIIDTTTDDFKLMAGTPIGEIENFYNSTLPKISNVLQKIISNPTNESIKVDFDFLQTFVQELLKYIDSDKIRKDISSFNSKRSEATSNYFSEIIKSISAELEKKTNPLDDLSKQKLTDLKSKLEKQNKTPAEIIDCIIEINKNIDLLKSVKVTFNINPSKDISTYNLLNP